MIRDSRPENSLALEVRCPAGVDSIEGEEAPAGVEEEERIMKKLAIWFVLFAVAVLVAAVPNDAPRNVRLRVQVAEDSLLFRLQWNAPQRGRFQTPIEGYVWELWAGATSAGLDSMLASGATAPNNRLTEISVHFDCTFAVTYYTARVRATGNFSGTPPWGSSNSFLMDCDDSPPAPPVVDLDTIPADTSTVEPDSLVLLAVDLGHVGWERETQKFSFTALGDVAKMCAFAYRAGEGSLLPRGPMVATMDSAQVVTRSDVVNVADAPPLGAACWYLTAIGNGNAEIHLCTTDCPALQAFGLSIFPPWMKWPLLVVGMLLWVFDSRIGRWWKRRRA